MENQEFKGSFASSIKKQSPRNMKLPEVKKGNNFS